MNAPLSRREAIRARIMVCVEIVDTGYVDASGQPSPCHIWTGPDSGSGRDGGYPRMSLDGQTVAVHIVNWTNEHGFIPGKKQLDHLCRTRRCIRDDHLEMVTHKQNQKRRDQALKTRRQACP
ncbi:HNH endonuclease signature motif containing protein [Mesorhizobium opportunistum]|uniref:HNH nuclease domain-containing protein n=1 Tax=Mesorhizobium opportunistum (strain LMG 24607 / HAMBI 3007 / WSM2075) TaxID=536019 RepID=F7XZT8_MESOW|nr:HNH endonuclease signature motif containing protein [Mesorhizobium opportunistum]AEH88152.1 conserved hypothetical protein [Mesorhizobium opportunistum WSM2075]